MPLTEAERAYIAGIIDGEGSIMLLRGKDDNRSSGYVYPCVKIINTSKALFEWMQSKLPDMKFKQSTARVVGHKDVYHWSVVAKDAREFLLLIEPYLVIKRLQCLAALAIQEENEAWLKLAGRKNWGNGHPIPEGHRVFRDACYLYVRDLNRRGNSPPLYGNEVLALIDEEAQLCR